MNRNFRIPFLYMTYYEGHLFSYHGGFLMTYAKLLEESFIHKKISAGRLILC